MLRELDRVADQIQQHLPDAAWVPSKPDRKIRRKNGVQPQAAPGGARTQQGNHAFDRMLDAEIDRFRIDSTRFKLREIQNIVQYGEQILGRFLRDPGEILLFLIERGCR